MATGATTTYDLTAGIKLDIEDLIHQLDPSDVPLLGGAGADPSQSLPKESCFEKKVSWLDEELLTPRGTLGGAATTGDTELTLTAGDRVKFQTNDLLLIDDEYVRITGYSSGANIINVSRNYSGGAAGHSSGATVVGVGSTLQEGSDPPTARYLDRNERYNLTEIFGPTKVEVTESDQAVAKYGVASEFDHQVANRVKEQGVAVEQALIYGVRADSSGGKFRSMGGFLYWISTNVNTTTTSFSESAELAQLQALYEAGGVPDTLLVGPKQKRVASAWTSSTSVETMRSDRTRGNIVNVFESDFGTIMIKLNRWMRVEDAINFERAQASIATLRPMSFEMLAKTGDARKGQIVCEKTLRFRRQAHAGRFSALT